MAAISYSCPICAISLDILALPWIIIWVEFLDDMSLKTEVFHTGLDFERSACVTAICYSGSIWTVSSETVPLPWTIIHVKFRKISRSSDLLYTYFIGSPTFTSECYKFCVKLNTVQDIIPTPYFVIRSPLRYKYFAIHTSFIHTYTYTHYLYFYECTWHYRQSKRTELTVQSGLPGGKSVELMPSHKARFREIIINGIMK